MTEISLTLKEALEAGARPRKGDYHISWRPGLVLRAIAAVQHWYLTVVCRRPQVDINVMHAAPIARAAPPSCSACGKIIGSCTHSGGVGPLSPDAPA